MAFTTEQQVSRLFKNLFNKAESSTSKQFFEEAFNTYNLVSPTYFWVDGNSIPTVAPSYLSANGITGPVQKIVNLTLIPVSGSPQAYYHPTMVDVIPFNFTGDPSYNYAITTPGGTAIDFGNNDWLLDPEAGVLYFYTANPSGISASTPPRISFYKYVGAKSASAVFTSPSTVAGGTQYNSTDLNLNTYSKNILYTVTFPTQNTGTPVSLQINNLGYREIKKFDSVSGSFVGLTAADISQGDVRILTFNDSAGTGSNQAFFQLITSAAGGGTGSGSGGSGGVFVGVTGNVGANFASAIRFTGPFLGSYSFAGGTAFIGLSGAASGMTLGIPPTDGSWSDGLFTDWNSSYNAADAFDDINETLLKLAPAQPQSLSTSRTLALNTSYTAPAAGSPWVAGAGTLNLSSGGSIISASSVTNLNTADLVINTPGTSPGGGTGFAVQSGQYLNAVINGVTSGTVLYPNLDITPAGPSANGNLSVLRYDWWYGTQGSQGFWPALIPTIVDVFTAGSAVYGTNIAFLQWSVNANGSSPVAGRLSATATIYYDNLASGPTLSSYTVAASELSSTRYVSGVPSLSASEFVNVGVTASNVISYVYPSLPAGSTSNITAPVTAASSELSGTQNPGATYVKTLQLNLDDNQYAENITATIFIRNAIGSTSQAVQISDSVLGKTMRIDTVSSENRVTSGGNFDYPTTFGSSYSSSTYLVSATDYAYELQLLNGLYRRITGDYTANYPVAGPNYSSDSTTQDRWATFASITLSAASSFNITIAGASTFVSATNSGSQVTDNVKIYAKVGLSSFSAGTNSYWIDANNPFSPGTSPGSSSNGQAGMVTANSTASGSQIRKRVTFGTANTWTGTVYVRIGLPSGSTKQFSTVTVSNV